MSSRPRIIFYCGGALQEWAPPSLKEGIGGSETAVIWIARKFAEAGYVVDVYNHAGRYEGEYDGVGYWDPKRLGTDEVCDALVVWRQPGAHSLPVRSRFRLLWCHDHNYGPQSAADTRGDRWDRVLGVSRYHADFLQRAYGLDPAKVDYVPNGIDLARFDQTIRKVPGRCVYASSPDRDLETLLKLWPRIRGDETSPELHVAYGWHNIDAMIRMGRRDLVDLKDRIVRLVDTTPGVVWRDRLGQDDLATLYAESYAMLYPTAFAETSCISAMEACAGGCVPITSSTAALKETVGAGGVVVWGPEQTRSNPYSGAWRDYYTTVAQGVLFEFSMRKQAELRAREWAKRWTWDAAFEKWQAIIASPEEIAL